MPIIQAEFGALILLIETVFSLVSLLHRVQFFFNSITGKDCYPYLAYYSGHFTSSSWAGCSWSRLLSSKVTISPNILDNSLARSKGGSSIWVRVLATWSPNILSGLKACCWPYTHFSRPSIQGNSIGGRVKGRSKSLRYISNFTHQNQLALDQLRMELEPRGMLLVLAVIQVQLLLRLVLFLGKQGPLALPSLMGKLLAVGLDPQLRNKLLL